MPPPNKRRGFFSRISKNLDHVDKRTLLSHLESEASINENWVRAMGRLEEGVMITTPQGVIEFINPAAERQLGITASSAKPFWSDIEDMELRTFFSEHLPKSTSETSQTFKILHPSERNLKVLIQPDIFKNPKRHMIITVDQTNPLTSEIEHMARKRFEAVLRLAGGLAHEIGNPLNALTLHVEILKKQIEKLKIADKDSIEGTLQILQSELARLDRIVRNFLKSTRRGPLRFQLRDLSTIIRDVIKFMQPALEEHSIDCEIEIPPMVEFFLDEERMRSVFINLIQNAIEAMPDGGTLNLSITVKGTMVKIIVSDTGYGISPDDLPHIFEAYYTTKKNGSGLGLMFVYEAITDHGGKIQVESRKNKGSRFQITLPLRRSNLQIKHDPKPAEI